VNRAATRTLVVGALALAAIGAPPCALAAALGAAVTPPAHRLIAALVALGVVLWAIVVAALGRTVLEVLRHGSTSSSGPLAWLAVRLAASVLVLAPFLEASGAAAVRTSAASATHGTARSALTASRRFPRLVPSAGHKVRSGPVAPSIGTGALLCALAASLRRRRRAAGRIELVDDTAIDAETTLLQGREDALPAIAVVAGALAASRGLGETAHVVLAGATARLADATWQFDSGAPRRVVKCLAVVLGEARGATHVALVPAGGRLDLAGVGAAATLDDALRVAMATGLGRPVPTSPESLLYTLATRADDDLVVLVADAGPRDAALAERCASISLDAPAPFATVDDDRVVLCDGTVLIRSALSAATRSLLDGDFDRPMVVAHGLTPGATGRDAADDTLHDGPGRAVVRLLAAVPRIDGLAGPLGAARERGCVELASYLAVHAGEPVTGERLRVRVLGDPSTDAAAQTLFNMASYLRRALGEGTRGPRLPSASRSGRYALADDVVCDVSVLAARVARAGRACGDEEKMAWLRAALELIESEPFATVLQGYEWFLTEGHLSRLQATVEDAAVELVRLAVRHGHLSLGALAIDKARLVDPHSEALAAAAAQLAAARQASFEAMPPAVRSTVPSAPAVR